MSLGKRIIFINFLNLKTKMDQNLEQG